MKSKICLIASLLLACSSFAQTDAEPASVRWICTTEKSCWQELAVTNVVALAAGAIKLDPKTAFQTMDGFGGCFNELGWEALQAIPTDHAVSATLDTDAGLARLDVPAQSMNTVVLR